MGIDEVRTLIYAAYQTPLSGSQRHFILAYADFTIEAQNALLKLLEEPPLTAQFYIVTENEGKLIPTLVSRLVKRGEEDAVTTRKVTDAVSAFFAASYPERLSEIAEKNTAKDDAWALQILNALETYAERERDVAMMRSLTDLRSMFFAPGASKKMILEHLALILPPKAQVR
jgi:DNA polymerase III delta prime subunit